MNGNVIIVGGGIVGSTAAYFLGKKGYRVTLLEKEFIAYGSSGRNPGYLLLHNRITGTAMNLAKLGMSIYPQMVEEIGDCFEYRNNGSLTYFYTTEQRQVLEEFVEMRQRVGVEVELLERSEAKELASILPDSILGALYTPLDGQINTRLFVQNIAKAATERYDVKILTGVEVDGLVKEGNKVIGVNTSNGEYFGERVVIATGAYSPLLEEKTGLNLPVHQERLQVLETEPIGQELKHIVYGPTALKHYGLLKECPSFKEEYFQIPEEENFDGDLVELVCQRADGSLLIGCPSDYPGLTSQDPTLNGIQLMINNFKNQFEHLNIKNVKKVWAGWLPFTTDGLPIIDDNVEGYDNLIIGVGHVFGNTAGPATGKLIEEMIDGRELSVNIEECKYDRLLPALSNASW